MNMVSWFHYLLTLIIWFNELLFLWKWLFWIHYLLIQYIFPPFSHMDLFNQFLM